VVEAAIELYGVEDLGITLQPASLRQSLGVQNAAPIRVLPTRGPDPNPRVCDACVRHPTSLRHGPARFVASPVPLQRPLARAHSA
jgi:hypothetical protein